jgi:hypothetical protein
MPFVCPNLVQETTTSTGTGVITLDGAVTGALDFDSQLANGDTVPYTIENDTQKEVGIGIFSTTGPTLLRLTVLYSTNGGAKVNFSAGTKNVIAGLPGEMVSSLIEHGASDGFLAQTAARTYARRTLTAGIGLTVTDGDGVAGDPTIASTYRRIEEFGAIEGVGNAATNNTAFAAAITWLGAQTEPAAIVFPSGIWEYSDNTLNWATGDHHHVIGHGTVRLRFTGTGNAFTLDGGATGPGILNMRVGPFLIEASSSASHGCFIRAIQHSKIDLNVRGCGSSSAAFRIIWCVLNDFRLVASVNEGGWYSAGAPLYGLLLESRSTAEQVSYNRFYNVMMEGPSYGGYFTGALGNVFVCGAFEGCATKGLEITNSTENGNNVFYGTDFEQNGPASAGPDIQCNSRDNEFYGVDTFRNFLLGANAVNNKIIGGAHRDITLTAGATANILNSFTIDRFGNIPAGTITGDKQANIIRDYIDNAGNLTTVDGLTLNPTTLPNWVVIDAGPTASPFTYTNTNDKMELVAVLSNANVTDVSFIRNGTGENISTTWGAWPLAPGDGIQVTFPDPTGPKIVAAPFAR